MNRVYLQSTIPPELNHQRLDQAAAQLFPEYSRAQLQHWIREAKLKLDGQLCLKPREKISAGSFIEIDALIEPPGNWEAESIPLNIVYEDEDLLILNKAPGLVVHPGAGNPKGTLLNALLHHAPQFASLPRAGIVHRLDKETSGLLVVAKNLVTHTALVRALQKHSIQREYEAIVCGKMISGGSIEAPIGRHPTRRTSMAVTPSGREALTHYRVLERFAQHTRLWVQLETGRTHQIRVHMAHLSHPIVGDPLYGKKQRVAGISQTLQDTLMQFNRQALHALRLSLVHPRTQVLMSWEAALPTDIQELIIALRSES